MAHLALGCGRAHHKGIRAQRHHERTIVAIAKRLFGDLGHRNWLGCRLWRCFLYIWTARYRLAEVPFATDSIDPFFNTNRSEDLAEAEQLLRAQRS
jgi:hypothetical protein